MAPNFCFTAPIAAVIAFLLLLLSVSANKEQDLRSKCKGLESTGIKVDYSMNERYAAMHKRSIHTLQFPPPLSNYYLNVPAKSGNENWRTLMYRLWFDKVPKSFWEEVDPASEHFTISEKLRLKDPEQHVWMVVRNPYVRLLSIYFEKLDCSNALQECRERSAMHNFAGACFFYRSSHMFRNYGRLSFEQFVIALANHILFDDNRGAPTLSADFMELWIRSKNRSHERSGNFSDHEAISKWSKPIKIWGDREVIYKSRLPDLLADPVPCAKRPADVIMSLVDPTGRVRKMDWPDPLLVTPVERAHRLCSNDHHTCVQSSGMLKQQQGRVKVLREEEQGRWYVSFLRCFNIREDQVLGEEWQEIEHQNCYYTPTEDCADALKVFNETELTSGGMHGHGTVSKMLDHYTPLAAELVYFLYEYDFQILGYKKWDGVSAFVPF